MSDPCTVLIAAPELLPALRERAGTLEGELLTFADSDALRALEVITERRPTVVALERLFAATPRGAALINRIKADPGLTGSEIRVVSHDTDYIRVSKRRAANPVPQAPASEPAAEPAEPLDRRGTRRAPRFRVVPGIEIAIDGNQAALVDLSTIGAQVLSPIVLKPHQRIRVALNDEHGAIRFNGAVSWASFEIPASGAARYRAGIHFVDADVDAVGEYCRRHKA